MELTWRASLETGRPDSLRTAPAPRQCGHAQGGRRAGGGLGAAPSVEPDRALPGRLGRCFVFAPVDISATHSSIVSSSCATRVVKAAWSRSFASAWSAQVRSAQRKQPRAQPRASARAAAGEGARTKQPQVAPQLPHLGLAQLERVLQRRHLRPPLGALGLQHLLGGLVQRELRRLRLQSLGVLADRRQCGARLGGPRDLPGAAQRRRLAVPARRRRARPPPRVAARLLRAEPRQQAVHALVAANADGVGRPGRLPLRPLVRARLLERGEQRARHRR